ncbi:hypothetical protein NBM05_03660 [Rothia sp. AR01]|uniref:Uncharacterized protein n=1 Tax=Rothia santali TaxID=2949643 RepID=A0A9X2HBG3_9MICC|nr:hypothetical protein [Rothia santali]MCP3425145.1 hypothetical protein [Rothia santali]
MTPGTEHELTPGRRPLGTKQPAGHSPAINVSIRDWVHAALKDLAAQRQSTVSTVVREIISEQILTGYTPTSAAKRGVGPRKILNFRVPAAVYARLKETAEHSEVSQGKHSALAAAMIRDWLLNAGYGPDERT